MTNTSQTQRAAFFAFCIITVSIAYADPVISGTAKDHRGEPLESGWVMLRNAVGEINHAADLRKSKGLWAFPSIPDGTYDIFIHNNSWDVQYHDLNKPYPGGATREASDIIHLVIQDGVCDIKSPINLILRRIGLFQDIYDDASWVKPRGAVSNTNLALGKPVFISPAGAFSNHENLVDGSVAGEAASAGNVPVGKQRPHLFIVDLLTQAPGDSTIKIFTPKNDDTLYAVSISSDCHTWRIISHEKKRNGRVEYVGDGQSFRYVKAELYSINSWKGAIVSELAVYPSRYDRVRQDYTLLPWKVSSDENSSTTRATIIPAVNIYSDNATYRRSEISGNYAFGRPVETTSRDRDGYWAVDGDPYTGWYASLDSSERSSITVDLQQQRTIDTIKVLPDPEFVFGYDIEGSIDGTSWRMLVPYQRAVGEQVYKIPRTTLRYIRYSVDPPKGGGYNTGLCELFVGDSLDHSSMLDEFTRGVESIHIIYDESGLPVPFGIPDHGGVMLIKRGSRESEPNSEFVHSLCTDWYQENEADIFVLHGLADGEYAARVLPSSYGGSSFVSFTIENGHSSIRPIVLRVRKPGSYDDPLPWNYTSDGNGNIVSTIHGELLHLSPPVILFEARNARTGNRIKLEVGKFSALVYAELKDVKPVDGWNFTVLSDGTFALGGLTDGTYYLELGFPPDSPLSRDYRPMRRNERIRIRILNGNCDLGNPATVSLPLR